MFCSKCGTNNPEGASFCAGCGSPLTTAQQPVQQQTYTQQPVYNAQDYQQQQQQYVQPTYAGQYQEIQQPRKKSRKGLIIGAACGGVAVITAGTLVLTLAQSSIARSVMGDVEYAKSVNTRYLADNFSRYTGIAKSAAQNSSNMLAPAKNLMSTSLLSKNSGAAGGYESLSSSGYMEDIGDYYNDDNSQKNDIYSKYDSSMVQAASAVYMLADMIDSVSRDGLTVSVGLSAELGKNLMDLVPPEYNDIVEDLKAVLSSSDLAIGMSRRDGALAYSLYFRRNGSNFVGAVVQISEDGQVTVAFPEATKRAVTIKIPSAKELGLEDTFNKEAEPLLSEKDIERLTEEITKAYLSCYEYADISYQDGEIDFDGNSTGCTVITATFDAYNIGMIIGKVTDVIEQDESAKKVLDKIGGEEFLSGMIDNMRSWEKDAKESTSDIKLVVESYVNTANQPLGVKYTLGNEQENYVFTSIDNGSYGRTALEINGSPLFELVDRKSGGSSGKAVITCYPYATSPYYKDSGYSLSVNIDYKDVGTFKAFGQETLGGTYTISIAESEFLEATFSGIKSNSFDIYSILTGLSFTVSMKEYSGGIEESAGFTVEDYGSLNVIARAVPRADIPAVPNDIIPIELGSDSANDDMQALITDILTYCSDKFKSDGQLNKLDEDFERITGNKISSIFTSSMKGYTDRSKVNAANTMASYIGKYIDTYLTDADTYGYGMKWYDAKCLVTGIVDGNGRWELMLSDTDCFKSTENGKWEKSAVANANESKSDTDSASKKLAIELAKMFPDMKNCCFEAYLANGRCVAIWFTNSTDTPSLVSGFYGGSLADDYGWKDYSFSWNGTTAGITNEGYVVGTYPQLGLKY